MTNTVLKRVVRRETHSPRTVVTVIVIVLVIAAAVYAGIELVLWLLGATPLLIAPGAAWLFLIRAPQDHSSAVWTAGGAAVAVAGAVLLWLALSPGRRPRHEMGISSHAVVVDNAVIASAVAERVRRELDLSRGGVIVGISHRGADVTVRPEPGQDVDRAQVRSIAESELSGYAASPAMKVRARLVRPRDAEGAS